MSAQPTVLLVHGLWSGPGTWWRVGPELEARGWRVETATLAGHGGRPVGGSRSLRALADDVVAQRPDGCTVVVGHSFGAVVALELAVAHPSYAGGVLLEDPPGRGGGRRTTRGADSLAAQARAAHDDPVAAVASLRAGHPTWSRGDARSVVEGQRGTDPEVASRRLPFDLVELVRASPVPVGVLACAGRYSALAEPQRTTLRRLLPADRFTELPGSHHVHLDQPERWVEAVDAFGGRRPEVRRRLQADTDPGET